MYLLRILQAELLQALNNNLETRNELLSRQWRPHTMMATDTKGQVVARFFAVQVNALGVMKD